MLRCLDNIYIYIYIYIYICVLCVYVYAYMHMVQLISLSLCGKFVPAFSEIFQVLALRMAICHFRYAILKYIIIRHKSNH